MISTPRGPARGLRVPGPLPVKARKHLRNAPPFQLSSCAASRGVQARDARCFKFGIPTAHAPAAGYPGTGYPVPGYSGFRDREQLRMPTVITTTIYVVLLPGYCVSITEELGRTCKRPATPSRSRLSLIVRDRVPPASFGASSHRDSVTVSLPVTRASDRDSQSRPLGRASVTSLRVTVTRSLRLSQLVSQVVELPYLISISITTEYPGYVC
eukprot:2646095-Rhodomonas_salina.1